VAVAWPTTQYPHIAYTALHAAIDTLEAFSAGLQSFIDRKLLPPARH